MKTFTERELEIIRGLYSQPPQTVRRIYEACRQHSYCNPLPLFRVYRIDEQTFEAQWNDYHRPGPRQVFTFADVLELQPQ